MKNATSLPESSFFLKDIKNYDYADTYTTTVNLHNVSSQDLIHEFFHASPKWVNSLFQIRNKLVKLIGLKADSINLDDLQAPYEKGQKLGLFHILNLNEKEAILGEDDKHLNFKISLLIEPNNTLSISTIIHINNRIGRAYLFLVKPFHKFIVPIIAKKMSASLEKKSKE